MAEIYKNPFIEENRYAAQQAKRDKDRKKSPYSDDYDEREKKGITPYQWLESQPQEEKDRLYKTFKEKFPDLNEEDVFQHRNPFGQPEDETTTTSPDQRLEARGQGILEEDIREMARIRSLKTYEERDDALNAMLSRVDRRHAEGLAAARRRLNMDKADPYEGMDRETLRREIPGKFGKNPSYEDWVKESDKELQMLKETGRRTLPEGKGKPRGRQHWQRRYK